MKYSSRKIATIGGTGTVVLVVAGVAIPTVLTWLANFALRKITDVRGRVRSIRITYRRPSLTFRDLSLTKLGGGGAADEFLDVGSVTVRADWKDLLAGTLIGCVEIYAPRLWLNLDAAPRVEVDTAERGTDSRVDAKARSWQSRFSELPAFRLTSAILIDGEIDLRGIPGQDGQAINFGRLNLSLHNLTNRDDLAPTTMATAALSAQVLSNGNLTIHAQGYPLAEVPTFDVDLETANIDLTELRSLIEKHVEINVEKGIADLYVEAAAADGQIRGYIKPIFDHLKMAPAKPSSLTGKIKAWTAEAIAKVLRNKRKDRVATRIDFDGSLDDPEFDLVDAILGLIRNGFVRAERAALDRRIVPTRTASLGEHAAFHLGRQPQTRSASVFGLIKASFSRWSEDAAPRMAAALAYYTAFSMAPLLILAISVAGLALGRDAAQGKIVAQIGGLVGQQSAVAIQGMIDAAASRPHKGIFASVIGVISLIAGASGVLSELKSALNKIWRTEEVTDIKELVKKNVLFLGMLLGMGFLLTVSLIASAAISTLGGLLPASELILHGADFFLSVAIIALLFAAMYKFLPNAEIEWREVWVGAITTSVLFYLGKLGLGLYIGKSAIGSSYGAAGSILVVLLWVYYSGLIFYFGAELTKIYSERIRLRTRPIPRHSSEPALARRSSTG